jgi:hypothetical protein
LNRGASKKHLHFWVSIQKQHQKKAKHRRFQRTNWTFFLFFCLFFGALQKPRSARVVGLGHLRTMAITAPVNAAVARVTRHLPGIPAGGGLLGLPGGRAFWVIFCVLDGHFRSLMPLYCTNVHPRWFRPSLYTHPCPFFVLFNICPSPRELRACGPVVPGAAGTSGVLMCCLGTLRELLVG